MMKLFAIVYVKLPNVRGKVCVIPTKWLLGHPGHRFHTCNILENSWWPPVNDPIEFHGYVMQERDINRSTWSRQFVKVLRKLRNTSLFFFPNNIQKLIFKYLYSNIRRSVYLYPVSYPFVYDESSV